ncbi:rust resistance kinase Lr10-like [Forsythia ovata]|uniref:Rust resistance kinase Lr10-like n=1 Tax=Forsythia ovata TaxID=205694 RepID=A0ABD1WLZ9_9LAMI
MGYESKWNYVFRKSLSDSCPRGDINTRRRTLIAGKWSGSHYYSYRLGGPEVPSPCEEQGSKRARVKKVAPDGGMRRALVYEFLPNDSLEKFIFRAGSKRNTLGWKNLQDIALGIAKGIEYLHQGCDQHILHFDIKPHNILLDHNFNPKICEFGLAKLCCKEQSGVSMTAARGTIGYIAPEVLSRNFGRVSYKSDVYSFGMLLLEMVGGRKNNDLTENASQVYFPEWIFNQLSQGEELHIRIEEGGDAIILKKIAIVGLWCIQWYPTDRPSMKVVVQMLEGDGNNLTVPPHPVPATNGTNSIAGIHGRLHQTELAVISEAE